VPLGFPVPETLYVEISTECNLRCKQCHMWRTVRGPTALALEEKIRVIREFGAMAPLGGLVFTGGEPFKESKELLALCMVGRELGLRTLANTNGTYFEESVIDKVINIGPDVVVVSLDSHMESIHDFIRGISGTHRAAVDAIVRLVAKRGSTAGTTPTVYVSAILCELTLDGAHELVEFVRGLGVDGVTFQMLEPTFMNTAKLDSFFDRYWFSDAERAKQFVSRLAEQYADDDFVLLSQQDFRWMCMSIDNQNRLPFSVCGSHERNVWVDMYGETQLCSYMRRVTGGRTLGNIRTGSLFELIGSEFAQNARDMMTSCVLPCGMLNCHRKR
jgi:MoaA/NifB/PqqE/SkfB family radical SAM enzyme